MNCAEYKTLFSPYLDGAVTGRQMRALTEHLESCGECRGAYGELRRTQQLLAKMPRPQAPADLALKLRVMASKQASRARRPRFEGMLVRWENMLNAFMVPATAGLLTTVVVFGLLMGFFAPGPLQAENGDVPLMFYSAPVLEQTAFGTPLTAISDDSLVIEAYVDANGRVQDYRILSESNQSKDLLPQVKNMLIFTTFRPAMSMGRPMPGRAVLSFSKISVRG